jgi:hypothetical protein
MIDEKADDGTDNSADSSDRVDEAAPSADPSSDEGVRFPNRAARMARTAAEKLARANSPHKANGKRIDDATRMVIYQDWKAGTRHLTALARKYAMSFSTIKKLVQEGNKFRDWPNFEAQLALEHETLKSAQAIASEKIAEQVLTEWEKARKEDLAMVQGTKASTWALIKKLAEAAKTVDFVRTEIDKDGNKYLLPMSPSEALSASRTAAQTIDLLVKVESLLHDRPTENKKVVVEERWKSMTPEQLEYFAVHGKWPEGVNEDDVLAKPTN